MQGTGFNQNSHYVLVKALSDGSPVIDAKLAELGDLSTLDVTRVGEHLYSNKAPGLAFVTLGPYLVLEALGARTVGDPTQMLWALGLVGVVLPAVGILVLVRWLAQITEPGFGTVAAVAAGLGTLLLPFATLFFSHALSAFLVVAAFALLFRERRASSHIALVAAAGLVAGLACATEYPNAFSALVLGVYAACRPGWLQRGLAYAGGFVLGLLPLLLYNQWAFGSPTHLSYIGSLSDQHLDTARIASAHPQAEVLLEELFGRSGLITLSPVLVAGVVGWILLGRRGWRAEALVVAAVCSLYLTYNASYGSNFGGFSPGQRYVIPIIPMLAIGLATAFRSFPVTAGGLALVSTVISVVITATYALAGYDAQWFDRIAQRQFVATAASLVNVTGWYTILPFFAAVITAALTALVATRRPRLTDLDTATAGGAVLAWAIVATNAPKTPALGGTAGDLSSYVPAGAVALLAMAITGVLLVRRRRNGIGTTVLSGHAGR
jgi:4-amino-4-deoxy-L-arabinose transferase-like glycosyltransferase